MAVLAVILSPVYFAMKEKSDAYLCKRNMRAISKAIQLYAAENNDRLPPAFVTADGITPFVENDGGLYTWAYLVHPHMPKDVSFKCPKAHEDECYKDHDSETGKLFPVSYGMYLPMGGMPMSSITDPESAILITETSSLGYENSFDPHPYKDEAGTPVKDGFVITWDIGNLIPQDERVEAMTRLAYGDTKSGAFSEDGPSRHPDGNHFITVSGSAITLPPSAALVEWDSKRKKIVGRWAVPEAATFASNN